MREEGCGQEDTRTSTTAVGTAGDARTLRNPSPHFGLAVGNRVRKLMPVGGRERRPEMRVFEFEREEARKRLSFRRKKVCLRPEIGSSDQLARTNRGNTKKKRRGGCRRFLSLRNRSSGPVGVERSIQQFYLTRIKSK